MDDTYSGLGLLHGGLRLFDARDLARAMSEHLESDEKPVPAPSDRDLGEMLFVPLRPGPHCAA